MFSFLSRVPVTAQADALFSEAYACIEQGLCYDEIDDSENTLEMYERGLNLIKEAEKAKNLKKSELYANLMEARKTVQLRVEALRKERSKIKNTDAEVPTKPIRTMEDHTVDPERAEKSKSTIRDHLDCVGEREADLILSIPEGVQLFTINGDETATPTYPSSLEIFRFNPKENDDSISYDNELPSAFVQVGPWIYPLIKGRTPVLRNDYGAYVVPNPTHEHPEMMVAVMLSPELDEKVHDDFKQILSDYCILRDQETPSEQSAEERQRRGDRIALYLIGKGQRAAGRLQAKAARANARVESRGERYRANKEPTTDPVTLNPAIRGGVLYIHKGSKVVAKCSAFVLEKIGDVCTKVGQTIASGAKKTFDEDTAGGAISGTITAINGGIIGLGMVFMSLEQGGKTLCRNIASQTEQNVKIKYGDDLSDATHHVLFAAGHGGMAAAQISQLAPQQLVTRLAVGTGISTVMDLNQSQVIQMPKPPPPGQAPLALENRPIEEEHEKEQFGQEPSETTDEKKKLL